MTTFRAGRPRILDAATGAEVRSFPAAVWPPRRIRVGECTQVVAGDGWYTTFNHVTVPPDAVRRRGAPGGLLAPGTTVPVSSRPVALAAEGKYLGVAIGPAMAVTTYAVGVR